MGVSSGMELLTLPHGHQLRLDLLERYGMERKQWAASAALPVPCSHLAPVGAREMGHLTAAPVYSL